MKDNEINNKSRILKIYEAVEKFGLGVLDKIHLKVLSNFYREHLEGMRYLVCGALTTVVSLVTKYALLFTILDASNAVQLQVAIVISWIVACLFAYVTNRAIVFMSESKNILKEITSFCGSRVFTLGLEMLIMFIFVTVLKLNSNLWVVVWTIFAQIAVMVVNYVLSKVFVFKGKKEK
jgi:putative flippase GtrA